MGCYKSLFCMANPETSLKVPPLSERVLNRCKDVGDAIRTGKELPLDPDLQEWGKEFGGWRIGDVDATRRKIAALMVPDRTLEGIQEFSDKLLFVEMGVAFDGDFTPEQKEQLRTLIAPKETP